jgi:histidinol-phosphatase (PHP family)
LGNPHEHRDEVDALLARYPFDVVIGSMHWLNGVNIHYSSCFDGQDVDAVYAAYFGQIARIAAEIDCQIIAHFDRIFWPGTARFGPPQIERIDRRCGTLCAPSPNMDEFWSSARASSPTNLAGTTAS